MIQRSLLLLFLSKTLGNPHRLHAPEDNEQPQRQLQTANLQIVDVEASTFDAGFQPGFAADGNINTRWQAEKSDDQWLYVTLAFTSTITQVVIDWETAYAAAYQIQVTDDPRNNDLWRTVFETSSGNGGTETISLPDGTTGRNVRMRGIKRGTRWGYSIKEMTCIGIGGQVDIPAVDIPATGAVASSTLLGFPATNVIDNNPNTEWRSTSTNDEVTLYIVHGNAHVFSQVRLTWVDENYAEEYDIEASVTENPFNWLLLASESNGQGGTEIISVPPGTEGKYVRVVMREPNRNSGYSLSEFKISGNPTEADVGQALPVISTVVSSVENNNDADRGGDLGTDGDFSTRWASGRNNDDEFIYFQLDQLRLVPSVRIIWESAYASEFTIDTSLDGVNWNTRATITNGEGGTQDIPLNFNVPTRFVRMQGVKRGTQWGYSLFEFSAVASSFDRIIVVDTPPPVQTPFPTPFPTPLPITPLPTPSPTIPLNLVRHLRVNAFASSTGSEQGGSLVAINVIDDILTGNSRWASERQIDPQWIYIQLFQQSPVQMVEIYWEAAFAEVYSIQGSNTANGLDWQTLATKTNGQGGREVVAWSTPQNFQFIRMLGTTRALSQFGYSMFEMYVWGPPANIVETPLPTPSPTLPFGTLRTLIDATASSVDSVQPSLVAANVIDQDLSTRWAGARGSNDESIYVEMNGFYTVTRVDIFWELSYATQYQIQVSSDADTWTTVLTESNGSGPNDNPAIPEIQIIPLAFRISGKFVRILGIERALQYGYSIFEIQVYGT